LDLEKLLTPISEDAPCGPDLEPEGDFDYDSAYFDRMGELPDYYYRPGQEKPDGSMSPDNVFDPKDVNFREEAKILDPVLARTKDLRLVLLRAQWAILSGNLAKFSECFNWMASLLETFNADVHPQDLGDRRSLISDLNDTTTVIQPLNFVGLTSTGDVSLRKLKVARGEMTALQSELEVELAPMLDSLGSPQNAKDVEKTLNILLEIREARARLVAACENSESMKFSPDLGIFTETVDDMIEAITSANAELAAAVEPEEEETGGDGDGDEDGDEGNVVYTSVAKYAAKAGSLEVVSHVHATRLLEACEAYYRLYEPSSATLLLVTQARSLIGKPLLEALETLLPENVEEAIVQFSEETGFSLGISRIRALTEDYGDDPDEELPEPDAGPEVNVPDAAAAAVAIKSVEEYFRRVERSSPVPVLLSRARTYLDRDFQSIIEELIPVDDDD